jgi:FKBP-type peptidyl-prolyl cis-trans isomerase
LAKNATAEGVKVTESGLQYKVITAVDGDASRPQIGDMVKVRYEGTFLDDTLFDSSSRNDKGVNFKLDEVIAGWREGLQLMKVGEKFEFFIPSELAYGEKGSKGNIGKNATLIFKIELVELNPDVKAEKEANKNEVAARAKARADEAVARAEKKRAAEEKAKAENSNQ